MNVSTGDPVTAKGSEICSGRILTIKVAEAVIRPRCLELLVGFDLKIQDGGVCVFHADPPSMLMRHPCMAETSKASLWTRPNSLEPFLLLLPNCLHCWPMLYIFLAGRQRHFFPSSWLKSLAYGFGTGEHPGASRRRVRHLH